MRDDDRLDELPEALPLYRVAPFWRLLAVLAVIGAVALLLVVLILGIALVHIENRSTAYVPPAPPPAVTVLQGGGGSAVEDDPTADAPNLPYPVKADLAESEPYEAVDEKNPLPAKPHPTARERFLDLGTDLWKLRGPLPDQLVISADGQNMAYIAKGKLTAGPIGSQRQIVGTVMQPVPVPARPGLPRMPAYAVSTLGVAEIQLLGRPSWSPDHPYVYCADATGHLRRYDLDSNGPDGQANSQVLPFEGDSPAPLPTEPEKLVFVRAQPRPKLDLPGTPPALDFTEVVLGDLTTNEVRVLIPASTSAWRHLAVSPDGKRLALVSDRGSEGKRSQHLRVFLLDLTSGELKPLTPPATQTGPVCWTADSQALIYARSQDPLPADYWEDEPAGPNGALDLYQWDLATNQETRLSRGGGCFSPSVGGSADLFYLALQASGSELLLRRVPLATAREFAANQPQAITRDAAAWTSLINRVLEDSKMAANLDGTTLTPEVVARLAESFNKLYRERFQAEPPSTLRGYDKQRRELEKVNLSPTVYPALSLLLGALEGEYLVRYHGARWHTTKGPLLPPQELAAESAVESPFGYVANPFATVSAWARQAMHLTPPERDRPAGSESLVELLRGRTLVLTNDPAAASVVLGELADLDLSRGAELLKQGKGEEAEQVFQKLMQQNRHQQNTYLALQIGKLLHEHKYFAALQRWMEPQCERLPRDPRKFNLLGLALLEAAPGQAVDAFKNALRCDVRFEPAYLNLSQAYRLANDFHSARLCLQRYLALMPDGVYAADARRRLAAVDANGN